jgi:hypothetical protein
MTGKGGDASSRLQKKVPRVFLLLRNVSFLHFSASLPDYETILLFLGTFVIFGAGKYPYLCGYR